jgi:inhibitor of growth protein 3
LANFAAVPSLAHLLNPPSQSHVAGHLSDGTPLAPGSGPGGNNPANTYTEVITPNTKRKRPIGAGQSAGGLLNGMSTSAAMLGGGIDKGRGQETGANTQQAIPAVKKRKPPGQSAGAKSKSQGGNMNPASAMMTAMDDLDDRKSAVKRRANRDDEEGEARGRGGRGRGGNVRGSGSEDDDDDSEGDSNAGGTSSRPARVARASRPAHSNQDADASLLVQTSTAIGEDADETRYCVCNNVSYGDMIGCDDDNCQREWFHLGCVGLLKPPQGTWYCGECTQRRAARNQKTKKAKMARNGPGGMTDNKARVMSNSKR